jgi:Tfp pilus assembly protein PilZ
VSPTNRRRHQRVKPQQVTARIRAPGALHIGLGIENISLGGAFVKCNTPITVSSRVSLELSRAGLAQAMVVPAQVTTCVSLAEATRTGRAAGVGLAFLSVPPHVEAWLKSLVAENAPKPVAPVLPPPVLAPARRVLPAERPANKPTPDFERTQPGLPAVVPSGAQDEAVLREELRAMRVLLMKHEALIDELTVENRKLKSLLKGRR